MAKSKGAEPITATRLRKILNYDPATGEFRVACSRPGARRLGSLAGTTLNNGYRMIHTCGHCYTAHRLAWFWMTGLFPLHEIDHINMNRADNRWCNLREATHSQNQANTPVHAKSTSGLKGAAFHKPLGKWRAQIGINGKKYDLGYFDTPEEAHTAYFKSAQKHFGHFANGGRVWLFGRCSLRLQSMGGPDAQS